MILLAAAAVSCSRGSSDAPRAAASTAALDAESLEMLRESARELLDANCGACHTRGLPTALPRALAVYDLTDADWSRHMSDEQLHDADRRLHEPIAPTPGEGEARPVRATQEDLDRFGRYVAAETARRAAAR